MTLRLAYNTNGFPHHALADVATILSELGYAGIAITPDVFHCHPLGDGPADGLRGAAELRPRLADLGLAVAVETGARFVLDPRRKHRPTLLDEPADAARRLDMLKRCLDIAVELEAETFSFWSGRAPEGQPHEVTLGRLCAGARAVMDHGAGSGVRVCFEPEPGMAVQSIADLGEFLLAMEEGGGSPALMLDVGHVPVTESIGPGDVIRAFGGPAGEGRLGGVQLDDCRDGRHEHLLPGDGEIDFADVVAALDEVGFTGLAALELPRHDHDPVATARRAREFFRGLGV